METDFDIAVIGGGLAGRAAAHAAARAGLATLHVAPAAPEDRRTSALMGPGVDFLMESGLISDPAALGEPLRAIRIIDATDRLLRAPEILFTAAEAGLDTFGWNFANAKLARAFAAATPPDLTRRRSALTDARRAEDVWHLRLDDGAAVSARLLVGADGKGSAVRRLAGIGFRERAYAQAALVCDLELTRPLDGCSVEFHHADGPFTLVPAGGNRANLVWIARRAVLETARADPERFGSALAGQALNLFGRPEPLGGSVLFPLSLLKVETAGRNGAVLVGEAAHAFPPIGAQGLNLGLRDAAALATVLAAANRGSWDWAGLAARAYADMRRGDLARTDMFVKTLFGSLVSDMLPAQALRSAGLWALRTVPALRKRAIAFGMGRG